MKKHPIAAQILLCLAAGFVLSIIYYFFYSIKGLAVYRRDVAGVLVSAIPMILGTTILFSIIVYPVVVTIYEIIYCLCTVIAYKPVTNKIINFLMSVIGNISRTTAAVYDLFVIFIGGLYELLLLSLVHEVVFEAQWYDQLRNYELHTPISEQGAVTFFVLLLMFAVGMIVLIIIKPGERAPLITILSISSMYIGLIEAILFTVQILGMNIKDSSGMINYKATPDLLFALLIPVNMLLIIIRVLVTEIRSFEVSESHMSKINSVHILGFCNRVMNDSKKWPIIAVIMMIPLLIIILAILVLFGQAPDDAIKAFTETANYTFSTKIPPQNLTYDEHYLCTVAAGGHKKIVKPVRMGNRHGHAVVVNRQLLIANAFEQILEEKIPKAHRVIRDFYDRYGFPVARLIKSKYIADAIWILMKPLEWIFLIVIYLVDVNPEDRIASQYL